MNAMPICIRAVKAMCVRCVQWKLYILAFALVDAGARELCTVEVGCISVLFCGGYRPGRYTVYTASFTSCTADAVCGGEAVWMLCTLELLIGRSQRCTAEVAGAPMGGSFPDLLLINPSACERR